EGRPEPVALLLARVGGPVPAGPRELRQEARGAPWSVRVRHARGRRGLPPAGAVHLRRAADPMREAVREPAEPASPWPRRLALAALVAAVPLVFFGGTVTTLHAGLAIDGWLVLEPGRGDHFLWLYPVDKWFRDVGTFVEHTHRLF